MAGKTQNRGSDKERQPDPKQQRRDRHSRPGRKHQRSAAGQSNLFPGGGSIAKFLRLSAPGAGSAAVHVHPAVPLDSDRSDHVLCRLNADLEDIA